MNFSLRQTIKSALPASLRPDEVARRHLAKLTAGSEVVAGPFRGLKCPSEEMLSANLPKILGVYEIELQHVFRGRRFATVINIGAAEGFYATGLAELWPECRVVAYEAESSGREAIGRYAALNGVQDRIEVRGLCDHAEFQRVLGEVRGRDTLVLMDIEGGESKLLEGKNVELLEPCSILVELHDIRVENLGEKLTSRFAATHRIEEIRTRERAFRDFDCVPNPLLRLYLLERLKDAADEKRGAPMRWFWMTPKESVGSFGDSDRVSSAEPVKQVSSRILKRFKASVMPRLNKRLLKCFRLRLEAMDFHALLAARLALVGPSKFFVIQVGAYDGTSDDQISGFIMQYRLPGILLEPQPDVFRRLQSNYAGQSQLVLLNAALARECGEAVLFTVDNAGDLPAWVDQAASFDKSNVLKLERGIPEHGVPAVMRVEEKIKEIKIKTVDFETVLNLVPGDVAVELLQIDAEGYDGEVIKLFPFARLKPSIIRYEHMHLSLADQRDTENFLRKLGYIVFSEKSDTVAFLSPEIGC